MTLPKFIFDTKVFGKILKMNAPSDLLIGKHLYFATHIQKDELEALTNEKRRSQLMGIFHFVPQKLISTESAVFDVSRFDMAKYGDGIVYTHVYEELNKRKPKESENNSNDALIAETAMKNGFLLVTEDKALKEVVTETGGLAIDFSSYEHIVRQT
jgi:hypothetical protein